MTSRNASIVGGQQGFTITEMLVAMAIMLTVTAATFNLMNPAQGMFAAQPEVSDMQQRLRIGVETLYKDLLMAGGGTYSGSATGSLGNYFAPVLPYRTGNVTPDPPGSYKTSALTLMYVPPTTAQTTIADPMPSVSAEIKVTAEAGCPNGDALCGFKEGMTVLIFDASGAFDTFNITNVQSSALHLQHRGEDLNKPYGTGSYISQIAQYTYWLKTDTVAETYQLMRYDGNQSDLPIAENVVGLAFEYYGEPLAPMLRPQQTPPTTYGPNPPALGVDNTADTWAAGENCTFMVSAGQQASRLPNLGPANGPLIKLTEDMLKDGPWCPDGNASGRYDADLLRIRKIRVTLRVQVGNKSFRGAAGTLFTRAGTSSGGERYIPDQEIKFDVTPRNLNLGR
jgi:prepilin-type N-terminal cleavage/methylation domain-containing protein